MKVTNKSGKIIGVGELPLLPGDTAELPAGFENNPVILALIETGKLARVMEPAAPIMEPQPATFPQGDDTPPAEDDAQGKAQSRKAAK